MINFITVVIIILLVFVLIPILLVVLVLCVCELCHMTIINILRYVASYNYLLECSVSRCMVMQFCHSKELSSSIDVTTSIYKIMFNCLVDFFHTGLLPGVSSLVSTPIPLDSIISLTWTPPFSLDITDLYPDIT